MSYPWPRDAEVERIKELEAEVERLRAELALRERRMKASEDDFVQQLERLRWSLKNADEDNDVLKARLHHIEETARLLADPVNRVVPEWIKHALRAALGEETR